jgi:carbonic anhydrase/acetyltransferase-like protein (isoleucine patch superfamily)
MSKTKLLCETLKDPHIHPTAWVAPGARVIGDVTLHENASVWYNAVLRADINQIVIGKNSNVQDGSVFHVENERACLVGENVTVGHNAILHGCTIEDGVLIGMGAIILNGALIKKGAVVAAGALVKEGMIVPENTLVAGVPAKVIKQLPESTYSTHLEWAQKYIGLSKIHRKAEQ